MEVSFKICLFCEVDQNWLNFIIMTVFLLEILVNFYTFRYSEDKLIPDLKLVRLAYIKSGCFFRDLISLSYLILSLFTNNHENLSVFGIFFYFRLANLSFLLKNIQNFLIMSPETQNLFSNFKIISIPICFAHFACCFWHFISKFSLYYEPLNWLNSRGLSHSEWSIKYFESLCFVTSFMSSHIMNSHPKYELNNIERVFSLFLCLFSISAFTFLIRESLRPYETGKTNNPHKYFRQEKMNMDLQLRVRSCLEYEGQSYIDKEKGLLEMLPETLKLEILKNSIHNIYNSSPFLNRNFSSPIFEATPKQLYYPIGTLIPLYPPNMYIIKSGSLEIFLQEGTKRLPLKVLKSGDNFGSSEFITGRNIQMKAQALTPISVIELDRLKFLSSLNQNQKDFETFCMIRDQIMLYGDHSKLKSKCLVCGLSDHLFDSCPELDIFKDRLLIIETYLNSFYQIQPRKNFERKVRNKFNVLGNLKQINGRIVNKEIASANKINGEGSFNVDSSESEISFPQIKLKKANDSFFNADDYSEEEDRLKNPRNKHKKEHLDFERAESFTWYFPHNNYENVIRNFDRTVDMKNNAKSTTATEKIDKTRKLWTLKKEIIQFLKE